MARKSTSKLVDTHFEDISKYNQPSNDRVVQGIQSNRLKMRIEDLKTFQPLTKNQGLFFDSYKVGEYFMMLSGSAGTGKSFIALYKALEEVMDKGNSFNQVLLVRSAVQTRDVGFLKGSLEEKTSIYEDPYIQICSTLFGKKDAYQRLKEQGYMEFTTTTALRGTSFDNSVVILDECQNCTFQELDTVVTRIGHQSKIIFVGDTGQNDLIKKSSEVSGMPDFIKIANSMNEFCRIHFTSDDIVRSSLVKQYIIAKENLGY
jgi:phosphate starvation-inducible protein PhoH